MIIPIIFTLDPVYENLSQTWVFYKAITFCKEKGWPIIAQEQYFNSFEKQKECMPHFFEENYGNLYEYDIPKKSDFDLVEKIVIPSEIEKRYIDSNNNCQSDAYMSCFRNDWDEIELYLCEQIKVVENKFGEKVEAITSLCPFRFIQNICHKLDISFISYEWGPFRYDEYRNTAHFEVDSEFKDIDMVYNSFINDIKKKNVPILTADQILAIMLNDEYLYYISKEYKDKINVEYEIGLTMGYNSLVKANAYSRYNMVELYNKALTYYEKKDIALRYHPGDPIHARLNVDNEKDGRLIDFILSCKRIACIASNVEMEALYYRKGVYGLSDSRFSGFVKHDLGDTKIEYCDDMQLSFLAFVYIIPFELLNSIEYYRFRLKKPSVIDIYLYHLRYYLIAMKIDYEQFCEHYNNHNAMQCILDAKNFRFTYNEEHLIDKETQCYVYARCHYLANQEKKLKKEIQELKKKNELDQVNANNRINTMQNQLNNAENEIEKKDAEITHKESIIEALERKQAEIDAEITHKESIIEALERKQAEIDAELQNMFEEQGRLKNTISQLENCKSMKITAPLRKLTKIIKGESK